MSSSSETTAMPVLAPAGFTLGAIKPADAVAVFAQRKLLRPSFRWQNVWQAEHARAFAVAGVLRLDVLKLIRDQVDTAVAEGTHMADFRDALRKQLIAKGFWGQVEITDPATGELRKTRFNDARLKLIFDVNMRQSHAAGRWARGMRQAESARRRGTGTVYAVYRTMEDERVRLSHRPWDYIALPIDDDWWKTHFPPNGWRCRCIAFFVDEAGLAALRAAGKKIKTEAPPVDWVEWENKATGQVERVPKGIDPGFAYNPGELHVQRGVELRDAALNTVRPTAPGASDALQLTKAVVARTRSEAAFKDFLRNPPATPGQEVGMPVAAVPAAQREPRIASVAASALIKQAATADYPKSLPTTAAGWALSQAIIDLGQRLDLADGRVLWWWARGSGASRRVLVLELRRSPLVWWVQQMATLAVEEALAQYPSLKGLL